MKTRPRRWLSLGVVAFACVLVSSGALAAQQAGGASAATSALDQLTAPIALYPDALVVQILTASKNPSAVQSFAVWLNKNASLKGTALQDAAEKAGFDPALIALAPFPQVVQMMVEKPEWTKALGQAVTADRKGVADSIQRLRSQAMAVGNLKTTKEQTVETQSTSAGQQVIVIQPANPQVIYVPVYNTQTVYVQPAPPPSSASVVGAAVVGFTAGVIVANSHHHSYYYGRGYHDYWDDREDFYEDRYENRQDYYEDRRENVQGNQSQRQTTRQGNQDQRQTNVQGNQDQRQTSRQGNQDQRQTTRQGNQGQRQSSAASYQSGASARSQSTRGSASRSSSRGGGGRRK